MWMFSLYLACCTALASASPFQQLGYEKIRGKDVDIKEVPYHGSLQHKDLHFCSAAIISNEFLITAGPCGRGMSASDLRVRVGSNWLHKDGSVYNVTEIIQHERFNPSSSPSNDIALIKVNPAITFDSTRQPIEMFNQSEVIRPTVFANFTGWNTTYRRYYNPISLQILKVPTFARKICQELFAPIDLPIDQFCAGYLESGRNNCQGDLGGPLTIGGKLAGIASWGYGCGGLKFPDVYTEVARHRDWIRQHANV